jgi:hypothetical protein
MSTRAALCRRLSHLFIPFGRSALLLAAGILAEHNVLGHFAHDLILGHCQSRVREPLVLEDSFAIPDIS